jgi:hypothetical protein
MIAVASIAVRALFHYEFHESALLYVGIPFAIAIVLVLIRSPNENITWQRKYLNRFIDAFIIMFGSSVVLFEGFVCVAMFVPIYLVVLLLVFVFDYLARRTRSKRGSLSVHLFPLVILLSATEGVTPELSFDRTEHVSLFREVPASISQIKDNLKRPIDLQKPRPWFLQLFPMPYAVQAGTLTRGDVHIVHYRYYRWFVTNVHEGAMKLEISEVGDNYIRTTLLNDTSYIANYLRLLGTEIRLEQTAPDLTRVTLRINYKRILDPYWYFAPVTQFGVEKMAEHLMAEVIAREYE